MVGRGKPVVLTAGLTETVLLGRASRMSRCFALSLSRTRASISRQFKNGESHATISCDGMAARSRVVRLRVQAARSARGSVAHGRAGSGGIAIHRPFAPRRAGVPLHLARVPFPRFQITHQRTIGPDSAYNIDVLLIDGNTGTQLDVPPHSVAPARLEAGEIGAARPGLHRQDRALAIRRRGVRRRRARPARPGPERRQPARQGASTSSGSKRHRQLRFGDVVLFRERLLATSTTARSPRDAGSSRTRSIARHRPIPTPIRTAWSSSRPGA